MDDCNSESNKTTSSTIIPALEPDEYYTSGDVTISSSVPESEDGCAAARVSANDIPNTPENGGSIAACISESVIANTSESASNKPSEEDIHRVLNALLETTDSTATELEDTGILTIAKEVRDIRRNLIDLLESIHTTAMELDGKDFSAMAMIVRSNRKKGLFPSLMISEIKKSIMGKYEKEIDMEDYHQTLHVLEKFSSNVKEYNVVDNLFYPKIPKIMSFLKEENLLTKEIFLEYMKINKENDDIRRRIAGFKSIDTSGIVEFMKALQEIGILSEVLLSNYKTLANECEESNLVVDHQISRMRDMMEILCKIGSEYPQKCSNTMYIKEENLEYFMRCGKNVSSKVSKNTDKESKSKICRSEHTIPFCGNCGWRTSWLKAFKKRGVYIKEAVNDTKEHTWSII